MAYMRMMKHDHDCPLSYERTSRETSTPNINDTPLIGFKMTDRPADTEATPVEGVELDPPAAAEAEADPVSLAVTAGCTALTSELGRGAFEDVGCSPN